MNNISSEQNNYPAHIAIIMDGNRRWARQKNLDIREGHKKGAETLEKIAKYCNKIGIKYLTVYAFSTENWKRSSEEVGALMILLQNYLNDFSKRANTENIKIKVLGDISVLSKGMQNSINKAIERTKENTGLTLNIAFNYGGRAEITYALKQIAEKIKNNELSIDDISEDLISNHLYTKGQPDPDLLIRTSGELRTSNFLPWQIAYTEFYFDNKYWPDFSEEDLLKAIEIYEGRNRKFGGK
ncbi:di-trans poly-cis-decaprenylcistransferase [Clostridium sp. CAG:571]|jgi:undecaprenyl diphosphate synthase|nr:di-trans poly-cis-decaprenylcistransferase [Clostridium sp. CAG:571]HJJ07124.1 isoprenyl transferase [Clostridiaceae bacterium]